MKSFRTVLLIIALCLAANTAIAEEKFGMPLFRARYYGGDIRKVAKLTIFVVKQEFPDTVQQENFFRFADQVVADATEALKKSGWGINLDKRLKYEVSEFELEIEVNVDPERFAYDLLGKKTTFDPSKETVQEYWRIFAGQLNQQVDDILAVTFMMK